MRDPTLCAKRSRKRVFSRLLPFVVAIGGLLVALSDVSAAKPPAAPDLGKTVPPKKPGPGATPRPITRIARPLRKPQRARVQAAGPLATWSSLKGEFPNGGVRIRLAGAAIDLATIPAGKFMMGSVASAGGPDEEPAHRVRISAFELGSTEVTVGQFQAYCRAARKPMPQQEAWNNTTEHPVHNVNWNDATGYCSWATTELRRAGISGTIRLPTEAEWEYAARGGATGLDGKPWYKYPWGNQAPAGGSRLANFSGNGDGFEKSAPVGRFKPNGYGLRDMAGNVWEWCQDRYDEGYYAKSPVENPQGPADSDKPLRSLRGGSWSYDLFDLRASSRFRFGAEFRDVIGGFRLARTPRP